MPLRNLYHNLKALAKLRFYGGGGGQGYPSFLSWLFSGTKINFHREVGDLRLNRLVMSATGWAGTNLASARLKVVKVGADSKETEVRNHPLSKLFKRPNPYYAGHVLLSGIAYSRIAYATAYILVVKSQMGQPMQLWWEPFETCRPRWPVDGSEFISYYEIERNGVWIPVGKGTANPGIEVIAIREGLNWETRCGMNATASIMRELFIDQQSGQFMSLLLKNGLVPPVAITVGDKDRPFTATDKWDQIKGDLKRQMSGDSAAEPIITTDAVEIKQLGFDYSKVGMKDTRGIGESAFCSAMNISPISLHFQSGDAKSTYSNVEQYLKQDYRGYIVPFHNIIAEELENNLLPAYGDSEDLAVRWDYSAAPLMQKDMTVEATVATMLWEKGVVKLNEARERVDYGPDDEYGEKYQWETGRSVGDRLLEDFERDGQPVIEEDEELEAVN